MDEFEKQSMTSLLDRLSGHLDNTTGDENTANSIKGLRDVLKNMAQTMEKDNSEQTRRKGREDFLKDFFNEWDKNAPLKDIRDLLKDNSGDLSSRIGAAGPKKGTLAYDLIARSKAEKESKRKERKAKILHGLKKLLRCTLKILLN